MSKQTVQGLILDRLERMEKKLDSIIPEVATIKERSSNSAKIISAIGGLIAVAVSTAIAFFK